MNKEKSKIYFPCQANNIQSGETKGEISLNEDRHFKIVRNRQLITLDLIYRVDLKYLSKYELFLHLVNTLNRNCLFPLLIKLVNENDMPISITYRYTYLIQKQPTLLNYHSQQDNTDEEGKNKKVDINQLWEWTDAVQRRILDMVDKSTIKESVYPKQYQLIQFLADGCSQFQSKFYFLAQQLINQKVTQQKSKLFERNYTLKQNFPNIK